MERQKAESVYSAGVKILKYDLHSNADCPRTVYSYESCCEVQNDKMSTTRK